MTRSDQNCVHIFAGKGTKATYFSIDKSSVDQLIDSIIMVTDFEMGTEDFFDILGRW